MIIQQKISDSSFDNAPLLLPKFLLIVLDIGLNFVKMKYFARSTPSKFHNNKYKYHLNRYCICLILFLREGALFSWIDWCLFFLNWGHKVSDCMYFSFWFVAVSVLRSTIPKCFRLLIRYSTPLVFRIFYNINISLFNLFISFVSSSSIIFFLTGVSRLGWE